MRRLSHSLNYLTIKHKAKWKYDYLYPLLSSIAASTLIIFGPFQVKIIGSSSLVGHINSLFGVLVGFFIAALAAVSTFDRPEMDKPMSGVAPTMKVKKRGIFYDVPLSRRKYLSQLFGYLTVLSILTFLIGSIVQSSGSIYSVDNISFLYKIVKILFVYFYSFLVCNIIVNTLLGIFYLSHKIHDINGDFIEDDHLGS